MRRTHAVVQLAAALDMDGRNWGYELGRKAGVRSGTMYPVLWRMLDAGWLARQLEDQADAIDRPPRVYYTVTDAGREALAALLAAARQDARFRSLFPPATDAPRATL